MYYPGKKISFPVTMKTGKIEPLCVKIMYPTERDPNFMVYEKNSYYYQT